MSNPTLTSTAKYAFVQDAIKAHLREKDQMTLVIQKAEDFREEMEAALLDTKAALTSEKDGLGRNITRASRSVAAAEAELEKSYSKTYFYNPSKTETSLSQQKTAYLSGIKQAEVLVSQEQQQVQSLKNSLLLVEAQLEKTDRILSYLQKQSEETSADEAVIEM